MAFKKAAGWGNLPNGAFSPTIFSKEVQIAFRKETVAGDVTNNKYFGEISAFGDTVEIMKEPTIEISDYARGANVEPQNLIDESFQLTITEVRKFAFVLDDIEEKHSHVDFEALASDQAAYKLKDDYDVRNLAYMSGYTHNAGAWTPRTSVIGSKAVDTAGDDELLASMKISRPDFGNLTAGGSAGDSIPVAQRLSGASALPTDYVSPIMLVNRMATKLNQQLVPNEGRWLIIDPVLMEVLMDEDSKFLNADYGESGGLRNGLVIKRWNGFRVYMSNNLPRIGGGPGTTGTSAQSTDFGVLIAGHDSAVATAEQIKKVEKIRSPNFFGNIVRGLHLYGHKILRPEAIVTAKYNLA